MEEIVIVGAARTPTGKFMGALSPLSAPQLGAVAIKAALERAGIDPQSVDEVLMGNVLSAGVGQAPARQAALGAGVTEHASAITINKVCASAMSAIIIGAQELRNGDAEIIVAGGMESMTNAPYLLKQARTGYRLGNGELIDSAVYDGLWCATEQHHMGNSAEAIARKHGISREAQDEFAVGSHRKAAAATDSGAFKKEIAPVEIPGRKGSTIIDQDETFRRDSTIEALAGLKPVFQKDGTVTAGNAPGLSDGASAVVLTTAGIAQQRGFKPLACITGYASGNLEPLWLFDAPPVAVKRLLERTGAKLDDYELVEVNEAFSAQVLANGKVLGWDWGKVNVKGGGVALGHPIGSSGARIVVTLLHSMLERNVRKGLAALCHGGGGAVAMALELC